MSHSETANNSPDSPDASDLGYPDSTIETQYDGETMTLVFGDASGEQWFAYRSRHPVLFISLWR